MSLSDTWQKLVASSEREVFIDRWIDGAVRVVGRWWAPLLVLLALVMFLPGLDMRPYRGEEGRRALIALAMMEHGAWWRLEVLDRPYINKPPLLPWAIAAVAMARDSLDEIAVRLPIVLSTIVGAVSAGMLARAMVAPDRKNLAALLGGLAFLLSAYIQLKSRVAETDVPSLALVGAAFMAWALGRLSPGRFAAWCVASAFFLALAGLMRGPIPIAFAAVPMIATELLEKRRDRLFAAVIVLVAGLLPCLLWAVSNLDPAGSRAGRWAAEMRLTTEMSIGDYLTTLLTLGRIPQAMALLLPWLVFALVWAFKRPSRALPGQQWLVRALLLYIAPLSLIVLLWPEARERYAMPVVWPVSVLAGVAMADMWERQKVAGRMVAGFLIGWLAFQYVVALGLDGGTPYQQAMRRDAGILRSLVEQSGPGEFVVAARGGEPNHGLLGYLPRTVLLVDSGDIGPEVRHVAASPAVAKGLVETGGWEAIDSSGETDTVFLNRRAQ